MRNPRRVGFASMSMMAGANTRLATAGNLGGAVERTIGETIPGFEERWGRARDGLSQARRGHVHRGSTLPSVARRNCRPSRTRRRSRRAPRSARRRPRCRNSELRTAPRGEGG